MSQLVLTERAREGIAGAAVGKANQTTLASVTNVALTVTSRSPTPTDDISLYQRPVFPGYADAGAIVWKNTIVGVGSLVSIVGDVKEWVANGPSNDIVTGTLLLGNAAGNGTVGDLLLGVEMYDSPVSIARAVQGVRYLPHFEYP